MISEASDSRATRSSRWRRGDWLVPFLIVAVLLSSGLLAYTNSFSGPLVFDDLDSITSNSTIRRLWPPWGALSPHAVGTAEGRPVLNLSLAACYALSGLEPWSYHVFNLAVHLLAGLTLWGVVGRTMRLAGVRVYFGGAGRWLAAAVALLWMVHPLGTQSVTYVIQRAESMMGLFYLLTMYGAIRGLEEGGGKSWTALSIACCALGMATKEVMASAPLMVMVFDRVFVFGSWRQAWRRRGVLYAGLAATWAILVALVLIGGGRSGTVVLGHPDVSPLEYALTQCGFLLRYLRLSYWPDPLVFDYGQPDAGVTIVRRMGEGLPQAMAVAVLLAATGLALWRRAKWGFLGLWFWAILAPSSSFIPIVTEVAAEHRMYLPLAAVTTATVLGAFLLGRGLLEWGLLKRLVTSPQRRHAIGIALAATALLASTAALTWQTRLRNNDYHTAVALWTDTVGKWPGNARAHGELGALFLTASDNAGAQRAFEKAMELVPNTIRHWPGNAGAYNELGELFATAGDNAEAKWAFEKALELAPNSAMAHCNVATVRMREGKPQEAIAHLQEAIRLDGRCGMAYANLGTILESVGQPEKAIESWSKALEIDPRFHDERLYLADLLARRGREAEALEQYSKLLAMDPNFADGHFQRGLLLVRLGETDRARESFQRVLELRPDYTDAIVNLGVLAWRSGQGSQAVEYFQRALQTNPGHPDANYNLANALASAGKAGQSVVYYRRAMEAKIDWPEPRIALARVLASCPQDSVRGGAEALRLAEEACRLTNYARPDALDALAAAQAELGRFVEALSTAGKAVTMAQAARDEAQAGRITEKMRFYASSRPWRQGMAATAVANPSGN